MPSLEVTIDGVTREVEVEAVTWQAPDPSTGVARGSCEDWQAWHENGRPFSRDDYLKLSRADEERIEELLDAGYDAAHRPDPDYLRDLRNDRDLTDCNEENRQ